MDIVFTLVLGSAFIEDWVKICLPAMKKVKAEHSGLSFDEQCAKCEKVLLSPSPPPDPLRQPDETDSRPPLPLKLVAGGCERVPGQPQDLPVRDGGRGEEELEVDRCALRLR